MRTVGGVLGEWLDAHPDSDYDSLQWRVWWAARKAGLENPLPTTELTEEQATELLSYMAG